MSNSSCSSFPDHPDQCDILISVRRAFASFSLIGCLFMIFIIWLFRRYVVFVQRMILYLSIGALMDSIGYLMSSHIEDGSLCNFQAWWLTYFDWQVLLWVCCITFNLYMNVIKLTSTDKFEWLYLGICWLVPLVISCIPFAGDHYGPAGAWCWIEENVAWRMGIWYAPLFVGLICLITTYAYIIYILNRKASAWGGTYDPDTQREHKMLKEDIKPLRAYPFIYLAIMIFPLINRIQNAASPNNHVFALVLLASISSPVHGFVNAIVFGMDRDTLQKLRPSQIKLALMSRSQQHQPVREYPYNYMAFGSDSEAEEEEGILAGGNLRAEQRKPTSSS